MAHSKKTRAKARTAYLDSGDLATAAKVAGVPKATLRNWKAKARKEGDDWDRIRTAMHMAGPGREAAAQTILAQFLTQHQAVLEALGNAENTPPLVKVEAMAKLADAFNKTMAAIRKADPALSELSIALEIVRELIAFVAEKFPQYNAVLAEILEPFGVWVDEKYG